MGSSDSKPAAASVTNAASTVQYNLFDDLPDELIGEIFSHLESQELLVVKCCCKRFVNVVNEHISKIRLRAPIGQAAAQQFMKWFPSLEVIQFPYTFVMSSSCSDYYFTDLASWCPQLPGIDVAFCSLSVGIVRIAQNGNLRVLRCGGLKKLTSEDFETIITHSSHLKDFRPFFLDAITPKHIHLLATHCRDLEILNVSNCTRIDSDSIVDLATHCTHLRDLNLFNCKRLDDRVLRALLDHASSLTVLGIGLCTCMTKPAIRDFVRDHPQLTELGCEGLFDNESEELVEIKSLRPSLNLRFV